MRSSQLRKTVNRNRNRIRNKRKTRRNKRTKNARGGKIIKLLTSDGKQEYEHDDVTKDIFKVYQLKNGNKLLIFDGKMSEKGNGHGKLYRYASDGKMISMYDGFITGKKKQGRGRYETYDLNDMLVSTYDGTWEDDKKNGEGVYHKIGKNTYDGQWVNDKKHGKGVESGPLWDGTEKIGTIRTEGDWVNDTVVSGKRTITKNGKITSVYFGGLNGVMVRHGRGKYTDYENASETVCAEWDNDKMIKLLQPHEVPSGSTTQIIPLIKPPPTARRIIQKSPLSS
uniref:Uncharacterized protein n=1 Tax=viral metagenome TaxID=1070528 RepID=A0A6C0M3B6_9ZZZZ